MIIAICNAHVRWYAVAVSIYCALRWQMYTKTQVFTFHSNVFLILHLFLFLFFFEKTWATLILLDFFNIRVQNTSSVEKMKLLTILNVITIRGCLGVLLCSNGNNEHVSSIHFHFVSPGKMHLILLFWISSFSYMASISSSFAYFHIANWIQTPECRFL